MTDDFLPLTEAFATSVTEGERGAICVMHEGRVVLDLWGGEAAPGRPWQQDTLACCFSVSKGVLSLLAHLLIDRGAIEPETPVAALWPAFGQNGKEAITVMDVLTHRSGLPAVSHEVQAGDLYDWECMTDHLARSAPVVSPRAAPVYHNMTYGYLLGEILCRAEAEPLLPHLLRRLLTDPLDAEFYIGLDAAERARAAFLTQENPGALFRSLRDSHDTLFARSMAFFDPSEDFNSDRWRAAVIGSGSGHATARSLATLYGQFIWERSILSPSRQQAARTLSAESDRDPVLGIPLRLAQGIELSAPPGFDFGPHPDIVGHWGAGGAQVLADPRNGITFAYVTGHMADGMGTSPRAARLVEALYASLNGRKQ